MAEVRGERRGKAASPCRASVGLSRPGDLHAQLVPTVSLRSPGDKKTARDRLVDTSSWRG